MRRIAWLVLFSSCAPSATVPPMAAVPKYSGPASLPVEKCADDVACWKRRTLLYVESNELLAAENKTLGTERDDAREGETYARNAATQFKKEAEPTWYNSPLLWLGVGVLGGIALSIGAGVAWGEISKTLR
jgi:hypothetical protein